MCVIPLIRLFAFVSPYDSSLPSNNWLQRTPSTFTQKALQLSAFITPCSQTNVINLQENPVLK